MNRLDLSSEELSHTFAVLLRNHRRAAGLTQEELAERAQLSWRTISDLERGLKHPHRETSVLLAKALSLPTKELDAFIEAGAKPLARGPDAHIFPTGSQMESATLKTPKRLYRTNLPLQLTSFVGRDQEVAAIPLLLERTRLVTLTGTGGVGKTRLALQVMANVVENYLDGAWIVDLAPLSDPVLVPQAVAMAVGIQVEGGRLPLDVLLQRLNTAHVLLVLDNCEHVVAAAAALAEELLRRCPHVHILCTSREVLRLSGEMIWRVPSLSFPPQPVGEPLERILQYEAVQLFIERATAFQPDLGVTNATAGTVAHVCSCLDGIPLAIELAAARVRVLTVDQIATRLDDRFRLLTNGTRTALPRQQTLRALVDWSYDLLSTPEKIVLLRLSVFARGWTLEAAEAVCSDGRIARNEVLDLLTQLVDKSLVIAEEHGTESRYRLLETIRQYGAERLGEERRAVRRRYIAWAVMLAEQAELQLRGAEQVAWLDRLEDEHDNLRAALDGALEARSPGEEGQESDAGLRLASALWWFWYLRLYRREGLEWLQRALVGSTGEPTPARAKALLGAGLLTWDLLNDRERAQPLLDQSIVLYRVVDDKRGLAWALNVLGFCLRTWVRPTQQEAYSQGAALLAESLALSRARWTTGG